MRVRGDHRRDQMLQQVRSGRILVTDTRHHLREARQPEVRRQHRDKLAHDLSCLIEIDGRFLMHRDSGCFEFAERAFVFPSGFVGCLF